MRIKDTKIWKFLKSKKNERTLKKNYKKNKNMPCFQYENYLVERTSEMMKRFDFSRPYAYKINFENPITFTEKRQWLKLYYDNPKQALYTDKYEVRKHIIETIGEDYLIPLISIDGKDCFNSSEEIDFDKLPNSFVIKCTHGSHMNIIVKDKSKLSYHDIRKYKKQLNKWLKVNYAFFVGLELHYKDIKPRIIIEKYVDFGDAMLTDYKFFCFSGDPKFVLIVENRGTDKYTESYLDLDFNKTEFRLDRFKANENVVKPENFKEMVDISKKLCEDFPLVRVDLYSFKGKVYFGELTFTPAAGYDFPNPFEFDRILGDYIKIDNSKRENNFKYREK